MTALLEFTSKVDKDIHRRLAADLFNFTWDLMEKQDRSEAENETMINTAHASRFHWGMVGNSVNFARGEWQISRVYALLGRVEPALHHGQKCRAICLEHGIGDFDLGFAYEALARAYAVQGNESERDSYLELARQAAEKVEKSGDKEWLLKNINTVESLSVPAY